MKKKEEPLKVTFEAYEKDGEVYIFLKRDEWTFDVVSRHLILRRFPSLNNENKNKK